MDLLQSVFLGLLQGFFEWLPVSSQGQVMVAAMQLFQISPETAFGYAVFLHLGTVVSAVVYFRREITELFRLRDRPLLKFVFLALIGSAVTAATSYLFLKAFLESGFALMLVIGAALLLTGILQLRKKPVVNASMKRAGILTGLAQGFAVIPGISRSGVTTAVLLFQGFGPEKAFRLSFILSIPSVLIAEIAFGVTEGVSFEPNVLIALLVAAVAGYASMGFLLRLARKVGFSWFCFGFGLLYIALAFA